MGSRLYVGNLPFSADEDSVRELFSQDGREVSEVKLITDRDTGRPRGFGFVEMGNSEHADAAVNALNGHTMDGPGPVSLGAADSTQGSKVAQYSSIAAASQRVQSGATASLISGSPVKPNR